MLPAEPTCPAALPIFSALPERRGVVCRVMRREHERDAGLNMSAAASGFIQHEAEGGVFLSVKSDPRTVERFCHGCAVPVLDELSVRGGRDSYTYCPVWQAEKDRIADGREHLTEEVEPEPVSMGVPEPVYSDPWEQGRRDLDLLAGR